MTEPVADLLKKVGHSGLGSETEVTLLRLCGATIQELLDKATFARVLERVLADEYARLDPELLGLQAGAYAVHVLRAGRLEDPRFAQLCRFLAATAQKA